MSQTAEVEYVCYAEGGFFNLERALEDLLPQTLVKLSPEDELNYQASLEMGPFQPSLRPLELHRDAEEVLLQRNTRFPIFQREQTEVDASEPEPELEIDPKPEPVPEPKMVSEKATDRAERGRKAKQLEKEREFLAFTTAKAQRICAFKQSVDPDLGALNLAISSPERVYPFKKAIESDSVSSAETTSKVEKNALTDRSSRIIEAPCELLPSLPEPAPAPPPRCPIEPEPAVRDCLPQNFNRVQPSLPPVESQRAFHDLLAARSLEQGAGRRKEENRRRGSSDRPGNWRGVMIRVVGELIIFGGGGAVGAGIMALNRGEPFVGKTGVIIVGGVVAVATIVLLRKFAKHVGSSLPVTARV